MVSTPRLWEPLQEVARIAQATLYQMDDLDTYLDLVMIDQTM